MYIKHGGLKRRFTGGGGLRPAEAQHYGRWRRGPATVDGGGDDAATMQTQERASRVRVGGGGAAGVGFGSLNVGGGF